MVKISEISKEIINGNTPSKNEYRFWDKKEINWLTVVDFNSDGLEINKTENFVSQFALESKKVRLIPKNSVLISCTASIGKVGINSIELTTNQQINSIICNENVLSFYLGNVLKVYGHLLEELSSNPGVKHINLQMLNDFKIPLPPISIQQKIVAEIEVLEKQEKEAKEKIGNLKSKAIEIFNLNNKTVVKRFDEVCELKAGNFVKVGEISKEKQPNLFPCYGGNGLRGYVKTFTHEGKYSLVGRQGALCGNVHLIEGKFHATEHALVATPLSDIDSIWLFHKLVSMNLNQYATGTAQPGLSVMNLKPIEINVPPLPEQQKIVAEIEKTEAQIDLLEKTIAAIPHQKETVLKKYL